MTDKERQDAHRAADRAASKAANERMKAAMAAGEYDDRPSYAEYKGGVAKRMVATSTELKAAAVTMPEQVLCNCGHTVSRISVMNTSTGTSCPDCYDRMSE